MTGSSLYTTRNWTEFLQMRWVLVKLSKPSLSWHPLLVKKEFGVLIWLLFQQPLSWIGKWNLDDGVPPLKFWPILDLKKNERWKEQDGLRTTLSMSVSHHISLWSRIILLFEERNGTIWSLMKPKISKIFDLRDGKLY